MRGPLGEGKGTRRHVQTCGTDTYRQPCFTCKTAKNKLHVQISDTNTDRQPCFTCKLKRQRTRNTYRSTAPTLTVSRASRAKRQRTKKTYFIWLHKMATINWPFICTLCYKCLTGTALSYLCDCLQLFRASRTLCSASDTLSLQIPSTRLFTVGSRAFSVFGPSTRNDLPLPLRHKPSLDSFKCDLKTLLFPQLMTCHVFIDIKSLFAARFKLCKFSFV